MTRKYPEFSSTDVDIKRPISFVTVHFCDELKHNLLKSPAVQDSKNQLVIVDNRSNLFFDTLSQAMLHGIKQAKHDLVVVVHEDVLLLDGWQRKFEQSLEALEDHDPEWGVVGCAGSLKDHTSICHVSDPHSYRNRLNGQDFREVYRLDEHLFAFRRSHSLELDPNLPSIHNIGRDMFHQLHAENKKGYVVDAATIHKYADAQGELILTKEQSPKIMDRKQQTYLADFSVCQDYYDRKWNLAEPKAAAIEPSLDQSAILDAPIILLGRGGGGTRILSSLTQDCGLFIGNNVNISGDCMDLVHTLYRAVCLKTLSNVDWQIQGIVPEIRDATAKMLDQGGWPQNWGFKLPESLLLLPELAQAFPNARYIHFKRDPLGTILRRSHMTARLDNHVGRVCIRAAYDHFNLDRAQALTDDNFSHMAVTTAHQLALVETHKKLIPSVHWLDISFEDALGDPQTQLNRMSDFIGLPIIGSKTIAFVNPNRPAKGARTVDPETAAQATALYQQITQLE